MIERIRKKVFETLESTGADVPGKMVGTFIMTLIAFNVLGVILETVQCLYTPYKIYFDIFEIFSVAVFSTEYVLRLWSCTIDERYRHSIRGRLKYVLSPLALVDLIAILPFYLPMIIQLDLRIMRAIRLVRLFRIMKVGRYSDAVRLFGKVMKNKKEELLITLFMAAIMLVVVSSLMYYIENTAQPDVFTSIPSAMWWGVATLTTVGYGDIYPITLLGKILGTVSAILGIGMFALPAGILGSAFVEELHKRSEKPKKCPYCEKEINI